MRARPVRGGPRPRGRHRGPWGRRLGGHDRHGARGGGAGRRDRPLPVHRGALRRLRRPRSLRGHGGDRVLRLPRRPPRGPGQDGPPDARPDLRLFPQTVGGARARPAAALRPRRRLRAVLFPPRGRGPLRWRGSAGRPSEPHRPGAGLGGRGPRAVRPDRRPAPGERVRVLHIITRLILGGAQENTLFTAIGQGKDPRFEVTLLAGTQTGPEGDLHGEARAGGVDLVLLPPLVREISPWKDLRALWGLVRFMRARRFHIVHTHSSKAGILGRAAARLAGVPIVVHTLHSLVFHDYQSALANRAYVAMKRLVAPLTDAFISVSDRTAAGALAAGIGRPEQHVTIFSGMPLEPFLDVSAALSPSEAKRRLGIPEDAPVVGKIARLFPLKGHAQFLDAAAEIAREVPRAHFLLVGGGVLRAQLEARARELGIADRTVFAGLVPPASVPACIQAMDVVVHASLREGIARVLPKAGAVGKPVVTLELDGVPEVVRDGVSGYLVLPLDTEKLADRVVELLLDPGRRHAFGTAGRAFAVENFGVERMILRIDAVYGRLIAAKGLGA